MLYKKRNRTLILPREEMTLSLSINLKSITPNGGVCGHAYTPVTISKGINENFNFPQPMHRWLLKLMQYLLQN